MRASFTMDIGARIAEFFDRMRCSENTTSVAVNGEPSCHFTFGRRWNRHTVGLVCSHVTASAGSSRRLRSRRTSGS